MRILPILSLLIAAVATAQVKPCVQPADATDKKANFAFAGCEEKIYRTDPEHAAQALASAKAAYEALIVADPKFAPALNRLAQLLIESESPDDINRALVLFSDAADAGGAPYYRSYGAALEASGNSAKALEVYKKAIALTPNDRNLEKALLRLSSGPEVLARLWGYVNDDDVARAQSLAVEQLARGRDAGTKRSLLNIVAATLAKQHVSPDDFDAMPLTCELGQLGKDDASLRPALRELHRLYDGSVPDASSFGWWSADVSDPAPNRPSSATAFSLVARELAGQQRRAGDAKEAERYLKLAFDVTRARNPEAYLDLVDFYAKANRKDDARKLVVEHSDDLFSAKSGVLARNDPNEIYRYHAALGSLYAQVGTLGNSGDSRTAIYQLEHAQRSAADANRMVDPEIVNLLATSYKTVDPSTTKDVELRLTAGKAYADAKQTSSAQYVIQPLVKNQQALDPAAKIQFDALRTRVPIDMNWQPKNKSDKIDKNNLIDDKTPQINDKTSQIKGFAIDQVDKLDRSYLNMMQQVAPPPVDAKTQSEITNLVKLYWQSPADKQKAIMERLRKMNVSEVTTPKFGLSEVTVLVNGVKTNFTINVQPELKKH
jgi:tetratricopeptide (TPR) repeat protein